MVVAVNAVPVPTTGKPSTQTVGEESSSFGMPYEFPDDYSISLEEAMVS